MIAYFHHLGDYATGTQGFTQGEHGAYRLLLDAYYMTEKPLPAEDVFAIGKATTAVERKAVEKVLARKFTLRDGHYHHERAEVELEAAHKRSGTSRANGKLGGRPKKEKPKGEPRENPAGIPQETRSTTQGATQTESQTEPAQKASISINHKTIPFEAQHASGRDLEAAAARAAALEAILRSDARSDIDAKARMHLQQWGMEGVTDQQLAWAMSIARERLGPEAILRAAYVATIIPDVRSGTASATSIADVAAEAKRLIAEREARDAAKGAANGAR